MKAKRNKWTSDKVTDIRELLVKGKTPYEIAVKYGVQECSIRTVMKQNKIYLREINSGKMSDYRIKEELHIPEPEKRIFSLELDSVYVATNYGRQRKLKFLGYSGDKNTLLVFKDLNNNMVECFSKFSTQAELNLIQN